ncbi:MAG: hypothetical protein Q8O84_03830 [Nanoarchaeota archaeon]|nr:hypothetical protein [Nanoarchaeota archaeon]
MKSGKEYPSGHKVEKLARKIISELKPFCKKIKIVGSVGRHEKKYVDIDIVLIPKDRKKLENFMKTRGERLCERKSKTKNCRAGSGVEFLQGGEHESTWKVEGVQTELYYTDKKEWGAELLAYSSPKGSAIGLRVLAKKKGFHLTQHGLFKNGKRIAGKTEKEIYKALGRPWKKPEKR